MSKLRITLALVVGGCLGMGCGTDERDATGDTGGATQGAATAGTDTSGDPSTDGSNGAANGGGTQGINAGTNGDGASNGGNASSGGGDADGGGASGNGTGSDPGGPGPDLPSPSGTCPTFSDGTLSFTAGGKARTARVWFDASAADSKDGPVVFYWHGTGSSPMEAVFGLGQASIDAITDLGGIVVAPVYSGSGQFPWIGDASDHYALVDEVVACAQQEIGIDARHIHTVGMSAGGLFTSALSFARSNLMASVAVYSGGGQGSFADPANKFAAMVFYGGPNDQFGGIQNFKDSSETYLGILDGAGHFTITCDFGGGHTLPPNDGKAAVVPFFLAHPYGLTPSPYEASLPSSVPDYCTK